MPRRNAAACTLELYSAAVLAWHFAQVARMFCFERWESGFETGRMS